MPKRTLNEVLLRGIERRISTIPNVSVCRFDNGISVVVTFTGVLIGLSETNLELIESRCLLGVENAELSHHKKAVIDFLALFVVALSFDGLPKDDLCCLLSFANTGTTIVDLIEGAPPFALEFLTGGRELENQLIDPPVRFTSGEAGVWPGIGIVGPRLTPRRQFDICQRIDDLVGDLLSDFCLVGHVVSPFGWVVDNDVLVGVLSVAFGVTVARQSRGCEHCPACVCRNGKWDRSVSKRAVWVVIDQELGFDHRHLEQKNRLTKDNSNQNTSKDYAERGIARFQEGHWPTLVNRCDLILRQLRLLCGVALPGCN